MMVSHAVSGTSVESTIKSYARTKDGRGAYNALLTNHAGDTKYRAIAKSKTNFLTNVKWNGKSYPLENHVSHHRSAVDKLKECADHINNPVPDASQRVEYLLDSITSQDSALQAAIGNIRADSSGLRKDFEKASSHLIEVDPYRRATKIPRTDARASVSSVTFAGRGQTGVDLRWHDKAEFKALSDEQKDELRQWQSTKAGKQSMKRDKQQQQATKKQSGGEKTPSENWKKKFRKAIQTPKGLAHVMSVLGEEEKSASALQTVTINPVPAPSPSPSAQASSVSAQQFPALATKVQLNSILKKTNKTE